MNKVNECIIRIYGAIFNSFGSQSDELRSISRRSAKNILRLKGKLIRLQAYIPSPLAHGQGTMEKCPVWKKDLVITWKNNS